MRMGNISRKVKSHHDVKMRAGEVGRGQIIQCLIEHVGIFTPKHKKLLEDLAMLGRHEIINSTVNHSKCGKQIHRSSVLGKLVKKPLEKSRQARLLLEIG